ncbi:MAG TPA: hypothetical protein VET65_14665, partial [Candidatus Limnocylindrales bacterium]|nr:hypothetical protein [Candidatus Limnocylindrales bacterium]
MNGESKNARVLVIGEDPAATEAYAAELGAGGYEVRVARSFLEALVTGAPDPDLIVLCGLAVIAHPGHGAVPVMRVNDGVGPAAVVRQVHR